MSTPSGPYTQSAHNPTTRLAYSERAVLEYTSPTLASPSGGVRVRPTLLVTASELIAPRGHSVESLRTRIDYDQVIANQTVFAARRGNIVRLRFQTAENKFEIGTGFFVSPTIVQTSRKFRGYRVTGEFDDGVKVPDAQAKIMDGLKEGKLDNLRDGLIERFLPPRISPDPHHPYALDDPLAGPRYELVKILDGLSHNGHTDKLNPDGETDELPLPICCDFQFLRIQNYKSPSFFVPGVPMGTQHVGIMGFCGEPEPEQVMLMLATEKELRERENPGRAILTVLEREREMRAALHGYNHLTVSPATVDTNSGNQSHAYRLHNGSVTLGASGAPVVRATQPQVFTYMHVSGAPHYLPIPSISASSIAVQSGDSDVAHLRPDSERFQNIMISVNHPEYRKLYRSIVWPEIRSIVDNSKFPGDVREALAYYVSHQE